MTCINWSPSWPEKISVYSGGWCQFGQKSHNSTIETKKDAVPTDETETAVETEPVVAGNGMEEDEKKAFEMFVKIEQEPNGYHWAQNFLGSCYKNGQGVTEDYTKAVEWFTKSSEQENSLAMCDLGFIVIIWDKDVFKIKPKRWMVPDGMKKINSVYTRVVTPFL